MTWLDRERSWFGKEMQKRKEKWTQTHDQIQSSARN